MLSKLEALSGSVPLCLLLAIQSFKLNSARGCELEIAQVSPGISSCWCLHSNKTLFCCANKQRNFSSHFQEPTNALIDKFFTNFDHSVNYGSKVLWNYGIINPFLWIYENLNSLLAGVYLFSDQHINNYGRVSAG